METIIQDLWKILGAWLPRLGLAAGVMLTFYVISRVSMVVFRRLARTRDADMGPVLGLLSQVARVAILILGAITTLGTLGIDVAALVASLGLVGFALGFALKDALANVLAGIMIVLYRPFRPGDRINTGGHEGIVDRIDLRYTTLRNASQRVLIPNANLFTHNITIQNPTEPEASGGGKGGPAD